MSQNESPIDQHEPKISKNVGLADLDVESLKNAIRDNLLKVQAKFPEKATSHDWYRAVAYTVRDRVVRHWIESASSYKESCVRTIAYLSAEYLPGPHLDNAAHCLGLDKLLTQACEELGLDFTRVCDEEEEPGLGNGGLGRLASCFMDALATAEIPAIGYGIRYQYGIFDQKIINGWQCEVTDSWLLSGNPWEFPRPKLTYEVMFGGNTGYVSDEMYPGQMRIHWFPKEVVKGMAFDTPIVGYQTSSVNLLRLWSAKAPNPFDVQAFNRGEYFKAVEDKVRSESLSQVLYPDDSFDEGKALRLSQQYFFVSCSLQDMLRLYLESFDDHFANFHRKFAIQLNDTHPSIAVAELMRLLVDEHRMAWNAAWMITTRTFSYTNHTLLPEALETWSIRLFESLLPRHLEIIYEINNRFLKQIRLTYPGDDGLVSRLSIIDERGERYVRMAHLAVVGSHSVNGVAKLHSQLVREKVLKDFYCVMPSKFSNKTNGISPRRFLLLCNPRLSQFISDSLGSDVWIKDLSALKGLEENVYDEDWVERWKEIKHHNKAQLAQYILKETGIIVNPNSLFGAQIKRIHEYKRQHLAILYVIALYLQLKENPDSLTTPRTFIFSGKAAPGYYMAKLIIKLIHSVANTVNNDPHVRDKLKVIFIPDYNVKTAQHIYPAADLSEQLSLAGKEASGTGNMKLALNGALTIGTYDGANIEIRDSVGKDNFYLFGLREAQVSDLFSSGYVPSDYYYRQPLLKRVIDSIAHGLFSLGDDSLFQPLVDSLLNYDTYCLLADFEDYYRVQEKINQDFVDDNIWTKKAILNVARLGRFSVDRTIEEYGRDIWRI